MSDLLSRSAVDAAIDALLNNTVPDESISPDEDAQLRKDILDTLTGLKNTLRESNTTSGYNIDVTSGDAVRYLSGSYSGSIFVAVLSANRTYTLPNKSGTFAMTSDIPSVSGTAGQVARFSASSTIVDGIMKDDGTTAGIGSLDSTVAFNVSTSLQQGIRVTQGKTNGNSEGIYGINIVSNSGRNIGVQGEAGNSSTESIGVRGVYKTTGATNDSTSSYISAGDGAAGFFQAARSGAGTIYGIIATTNLFTPDAAVTGIAGYFKAGGGGSNYAIQLVDGTEGAGKYLQSDANGRASWVTLSVSNLGNDNLIADAAIRSYTLAGTAITDYLDINNGADSVTRFRGNRTVVIGDESSTYIKLDPYGVSTFGILQFCAAGTTTAYNAYDSTNVERFRVETSGRVIAFRGSLSTYFNYTTSINLWAEGTMNSFHFVGTNGSNHTVYLGNESSHGYAEIKNSSGVTKSRISGSGDSYFINSVAIGGSSANASCILDIQSTTLGFGLPSMTTTQKNAISSPRTGLMVFDNVLNQASYYNGSTWVNI